MTKQYIILPGPENDPAQGYLRISELTLLRLASSLLESPFNSIVMPLILEPAKFQPPLFKSHVKYQ